MSVYFDLHYQSLGYRGQSLSMVGSIGQAYEGETTKWRRNVWSFFSCASFYVLKSVCMCNSENITPEPFSKRIESPELNEIALHRFFYFYFNLTKTSPNSYQT